MTAAGGIVGRGAIVLAAAAAALAACATVRPDYATRQPAPSGKAAPPTPGYKTGAPYQVNGVWYSPHAQPDYDATGVASWYGDAFHLKPTANGEVFDKDQPSAAHTTLPLPSLVEVTNLQNGRRLTVRVNDRGPFIDGRIIDLSHEAARQLGYDRQGLARVRVRYLGPAPLYGEETRRYASYVAPRPAPSRAAPAPVAPPQVTFTSDPLPRPPAMIVEASLAPLPRTAAPVLIAAPYRVQAGAFSTAEGAQRAAARLLACGPARVEPVSRGGTTLYRVVLDGAVDQDAAEALRRQVAEIGFADARVIRPE